MLGVPQADTVCAQAPDRKRCEGSRQSSSQLTSCFRSNSSRKGTRSSGRYSKHWSSNFSQVVSKRAYESAWFILARTTSPPRDGSKRQSSILTIRRVSSQLQASAFVSVRRASNESAPECARNSFENRVRSVVNYWAGRSRASKEPCRRIHPGRVAVLTFGTRACRQ